MYHWQLCLIYICAGGTVPHEWKHANVVPIFKKGNRCKAENYRPVKISSLQTPRIIIARSYGGFPRKAQLIEGYIARVSKRTVVLEYTEII